MKILKCPLRHAMQIYEGIHLLIPNYVRIHMQSQIVRISRCMLDGAVIRTYFKIKFNVYLKNYFALCKFCTAKKKGERNKSGIHIK